MNIPVQKTTVDDVEAISKICSNSWIEAYQGLYPVDYIQQVIREYYNPERVTKEVYVRPEPDIKHQGVGSTLLERFTAYQKETYGIAE